MCCQGCSCGSVKPSTLSVLTSPPPTRGTVCVHMYSVAWDVLVNHYLTETVGGGGRGCGVAVHGPAVWGTACVGELCGGSCVEDLCGGKLYGGAVFEKLCVGSCEARCEHSESFVSVFVVTNCTCGGMHITITVTA